MTSLTTPGPGVALLSRSPVLRLGMRGLVESTDLGLHVVAEVAAVSELVEHVGEPVDLLLVDEESLRRWEGGVIEILEALPRGPAVVVIGRELAPQARAPRVWRVDRECDLSRLRSVMAEALGGEPGRDVATEPPATDVAGRASGLGLLTARELQVLTLLARGDSNKDIAQSLSIAENTVKNHVRGVLAKLGVTSRLAAATHALRHAGPAGSADAAPGEEGDR